MAVKSLFVQDDFNLIFSQYDFGTFTYSEAVSQGSVQTNYFLHTPKGKFVFRYYKNRSKESVLFESDLLMFLKKHQYPCPAPLQNLQGNIVGMYRNKPYVLFEYIPGQHIDQPGEHHKQQIIQTVAWLQNLTHEYRPKGKKYRWNYNVELCQKLASVEAQKINTENASKKLLWLEKQLLILNLPESLPKGICHCDFHFSNLLFQDDQLVGILDFDDANYTYMVFDLVCLIDSWAWPFESDEPNLGQAQNIAREYIRYRPLSDLEQQYIYDVHKLCILFDCVWYFGRGVSNDFYEKRKIDYLNNLGRKNYYDAMFA